MRRLHRALVEDTPLADTSTRMPPLTTSLLGRFGNKWTWSLGINDLYFDFIAPPLAAAGAPPRSALQRQRRRRQQLRVRPHPFRPVSGRHRAGAAEPACWMVVDELNRAFAKQPPSGYVVPVHLVVKANVEKDGGARGVFDPDNGYRDVYKRFGASKEIRGAAPGPAKGLALLKPD